MESRYRPAIVELSGMTVHLLQALEEGKIGRWPVVVKVPGQPKVAWSMPQLLGAVEPGVTLLWDWWCDQIQPTMEEIYIRLGRDTELAQIMREIAPSTAGSATGSPPCRRRASSLPPAATPASSAWVARGRIPDRHPSYGCRVFIRPDQAACQYAWRRPQSDLLVERVHKQRGIHTAPSIKAQLTAYGCILEPYRPATNLAYQWLAADLHALGWLDHTPRFWERGNNPENTGRPFRRAVALEAVRPRRSGGPQRAGT
jgi:hypothetical protein